MSTWLATRGADAQPVGLLQGAVLHTQDPRLLELAREPVFVVGGREVSLGTRVTTRELAPPGTAEWGGAFRDEVHRLNADQPLADLIVFVELHPSVVSEYSDLLSLPPAGAPASG